MRLHKIRLAKLIFKLPELWAGRYPQFGIDAKRVRDQFEVAVRFCEAVSPARDGVSYKPIVCAFRDNIAMFSSNISMSGYYLEFRDIYREYKQLKRPKKQEAFRDSYHREITLYEAS